MDWLYVQTVQQSDFGSQFSPSHREGPGDQTQVFNFGDKYFNSLRHLTNLEIFNEPFSQNIRYFSWNLHFWFTIHTFARRVAEEQNW